MLLSAFNLNELIQVDEGSFVPLFVPVREVHYECHMSFIFIFLLCNTMQKYALNLSSFLFVARYLLHGIRLQ